LSASTKHGLEKTALASAIIAFWPGIPLYYYGDEQGFQNPGTALDGWAREDFMTSLAWRQDSSCDAEKDKVSGDHFDQTNPQFLWTSRIMAIRQAYQVLSECDSVYERWHQPSFMNGVFAFTRACGDDESTFVLVMWNTWVDPLIVPAGKLYGGWRGRSEIWNVIGDYSLESSMRMVPVEQLETDLNGYIKSKIELRPFQVKVFVRKDGFKPLAPQILSVSPSHDAVVKSGSTSKQLVRLTFSTPMNITSVVRSLRFDDVLLSNVQATPFIQPNGETVFRDDKYDSAIRFSNNHTVATIEVPRSLLSDGIHHLSLSDAISLAGIRMLGPFRSRIRVGDRKTNILMNSCLQGSRLADVAHFEIPRPSIEDLKGAKQVSFMAPRGEPSIQWRCSSKRTVWGVEQKNSYISDPIRIRLRHQASGARLVRIRVGEWSDSMNDRLVLDKDSVGYNVIKTGNRTLDFQAQYTEKSRAMARTMVALDLEGEKAGWQGSWSEWIGYANETEHDVFSEIRGKSCGAQRFEQMSLSWSEALEAMKLSDAKRGQRSIPIVVQYWADDSAAYFIRSTVDL
jgi:hypothetical protein